LKTVVLLINLGTPDSPSVRDVRKYLREFLMDARVVDIPFWQRFLLVNLIIVPLRAPKSARAYHELWEKEKGSPLKIYGHQVQKLLQQALGEDFQVELAMRYQSPGISQVLSGLKDRNFTRLVVIPLYPQYASASSGSTIQEVMKEIKKWGVALELKVIDQFYDHPLFIKAFVQNGRKYMDPQVSHYLFSYHGLPDRPTNHGYRAQCFETTRLLVRALGIKEGDYTVCFQSRLGLSPWIKPYTDEVIKQLARKGVKNMLIFSPSFVADCLETTIEIGVEYKKLFQKHGGETWQMVESLNASVSWIECLRKLVLQ